MDCTPRTDYLRAICARSWTFKGAVGELIDNALDADAKTVAVEFRKQGFSIRDNGVGCAQLGLLITLGDRSQHATTKLGCYGIGGKEATLWIGGETSTVTVESVHRTTFRELTVRWSDMVKNRWQVDDPSERRAGPGEIGTSIVVRAAQCKTPRDAAQIADLRAALGYMYSPAIKNGRQITLAIGPGGTPEPLVRWELPPFDGDTIDETVIAGGKTARVRGGIVKDGHPNPRCGLTYAFKFRVILPSCANGCGEYNASRICGYVMLDDAWKLGKNKDAILDDDEELLYAAVEAAILPLLQRADEMGSRLASAAFESKIAGAINASIGADAKARRNNGDQNGRKRPSGKGGKHRRAGEEQDGETFRGSRAGCGSYRVVHQSLGDDAGVGSVLGPTIILNTDNAWVTQAQREKNVLAGIAIAASLISADHCMGNSGKQLRLPNMLDGDETKKFTRAMGAILKGALECEDDQKQRTA